MKITELLRYDVPGEILALWQARESGALLPLQELAVKKHGLFDGGNLLIQAPTSSGKTFIGEMAAIQTALRRKKVVYLVPLKALAEEKYRDFHRKYQDYGLKILISTRDHRQFDRDLEDGDFSIAVVVYEKLAQLLVRRPERFKELDLVVADELELLSDPERGAMAELLLTRILLAGCRLIGLSAVIGDAERLAKWMNASLVQHPRRPVELRFGVLHEGVFKYRSYNEYYEGEERLVDFHSDSIWDILAQNVCRFASEGESSLVFVKAKHESRRGAELLAERIAQPAASRAIERLRSIEGTRCRDALLETLATGVAFHNADLSPDERETVEQAFREGEVRVMVSTSTLAVGMNLPARNVFITPEKWRYDQRLDMPWKTPILHMEYENMGGRAGRYGAGHAFGRSILIATSPFEQETLWRRYVEGERERIEPRLAREALDDHVLRLVASRCCRDLQDLLVFLESTLTGKWIWAEECPLEEVEARIRAAVQRCVDGGVLNSAPDGQLEATPLGRAVAAKGITLATAKALEHWITESETRDWSDLDLLFACASTEDGRLFQVMLTMREYEQADYPGRLKTLMRHESLDPEIPINRVRRSNTTPFFEDVRGIKVALFLNDWLEHAGVRQLEDDYNIMSGQLLSAADQVSWLVDAAAAMASALGGRPAFVERLKALSERTQHGVRAELLPLLRLAPELSRQEALELASRGLHELETLAAAPRELLRQFVEGAVLDKLLGYAERRASTPAAVAAPQTSAPILVVDDRNPEHVVLDGCQVRLQAKQYQLLRCLAERPGECIPYETLYNALWDDGVIVEDAQLHQQKRRLLNRIKEVLPGRARCVRTVPKRGFVLDLPPSQVVLSALRVSHAA